MSSLTVPLSFANEAQYLLIATASIDALLSTIEMHSKQQTNSTEDDNKHVISK
jgi:uncharacterized protein YcbX